ncbi:Non-structural maintenance of chromosomes element 1 [Pavlovales sp. CCMP2436]|nr:Non-structural maintenance of chromosomes element 1 [Pavlovales sp. CCMP2436]
MHDLHRQLLQHLMAAGAIGEDELLQLMKSLVQGYAHDLGNDSRYSKYIRPGTSKASVDECVTVLNKELEFFSLKVVKAHSVAEKKFYYGVVNLVNDEAAQKATSFSASQVVLFSKVKGLIQEAQVGDHPGSIDCMAAENARQTIGTGVPAIDASAAEEAIRKLVEQKWLSLVQDGDDVYQLGPRSILNAQYTGS